MDIKPKTVVKVKISGEAESHSRTLLKTRDLMDIADEPEVRGGTNEGFAPTEMALASLIACSCVISQKLAHKLEIDVIDLNIELESEFNRLGVTLQEEIDVPFPNIQLDIHLKTSASDEKLALLEDQLPRYCPVAKVFSQGGSNIVSNWIITRP